MADIRAPLRHSGLRLNQLQDRMHAAATSADTDEHGRVCVSDLGPYALLLMTTSEQQRPANAAAMPTGSDLASMQLASGFCSYQQRLHVALGPSLPTMRLPPHPTCSPHDHAAALLLSWLHFAWHARRQRLNARGYSAYKAHGRHRENSCKAALLVVVVLRVEKGSCLIEKGSLWFCQRAALVFS